MKNFIDTNSSSEIIIKKAIKKIHELNTENELLRQQQLRKEPVAIIGMACRFPANINDLAEFWQLLCAKDDVITTELRPEFTCLEQAQAGGFLSDPYQFARQFFNISRRELKSIDPQQRLLLEVTWEALENAAIKPSTLANSATGVFVGIIADDYSQLLLQQGTKTINSHFATGNAHSTAAGRLAHWFDFNGPCVAIDTACSSSLVALHLACQSIQSGESKLAIVGAANCLLTDIYHHNFIQAGMLAPDGYCKVFDDRANGYVRSEGCAVLILKSLSQALQDNDSVWAVIKGSAINHDGRCSALTVPNRLQQMAVIENALKQAALNFNDIHYIEAHGTGTALGDPIEIQALGDLCQKYQRTKPLYVGSVKANVGHLEAAAGFAGLIKTILCLQTKSIPPQAHFTMPSSRFAWEKYPLIIPTRQYDIVNESELMRAGVSSFGFSGTNAHVIVESYSMPQEKLTYTVSHTDLPFIVCVSAKTHMELIQQLSQYLSMMNTLSSTEDFYSFCYTANDGREFFDHAGIFIANSISRLKALVVEYQQKLLTDDQANASRQVLAEQQYANLPSITDLLQNKVNWQQYYAPQLVKKLRLPSYPFSRERIIFDQQEPSLAELCYETIWQTIRLPVQTLDADITQSTWIIYHPYDVISAALLDVFAQHDITPIYINNLSVLQQQFSLQNSTLQQKVLFYYQAKPQSSLTSELLVQLLKQFTQFVSSCYQSANPVKSWLLLENVTRNMQLDISALLGAFKAIVLEMPELMQACVSFADNNINANDFFNLLNYAKQEMLLTVRHGEYQVPRLQHSNLTIANQTSSFTLSAEYVYVITGGTGGIAQHLIPWLVNQGVQKIALLSRTKPSADLQHLMNNFTEINIQHFAVDITQQNKLFTVLTKIQQSLGIIAGVFHAAGQASYRSCLTVDEDYLRQIFLPKVAGALNIQNYFSQTSLQFFIHFGSVAAVWGAAKMIPYAAANSCLEHLAACSDHHYIVHYGPWQNTGMAQYLVDMQHQHSGMLALNSKIALSALTLAIQIAKPIVVAEIDWQRFARLLQIHRPMHFFDKLQATLQRTETKSQAPLSIETLRSLLAESLACSPTEINIQQPLQEMGIDSIMAIEFTQKLQVYTQQTLADTLIFRYPTVEKIFAYLTTNKVSHTSVKLPVISTYEPIAIIGVACNVGDCETAKQFWQHLITDGHFIQENIAAELAKRTGQSVQHNAIYAGNLFKSVYHFDAEKFRISPKEAALIDPQQRLMLSLAWQAFESAGYAISEIQSLNAGVFIGVGNNEYAPLCRQFMVAEDEMFYATSQAQNLIAGRISYFFGLQGPSVVIDTACSSSLMAVHQACQSLQTGECDFALAGGVNLIFSREGMQSLLAANMLSPTGCCRPFDNQADGYVRAEAAGLVLLKPLTAAQKAGDSILGIIHSSAANQDGQSASLTAPSQEAQQRVMQRALDLSSFSANDIDFIETHGTGTKLGDPIEFASINHVFAKTRDITRPLYLNSIKSSVGHAEAAAGILSLIRALASVQTGLIPKQYGFTSLNKHIQTVHNVQIPEQSYDLSQQTTIIGGVSSFGFSGTNVHLILSGEPKQSELFGRASTTVFNKTEYTIVPQSLATAAEQNILDSIYEVTWQEVPAISSAINSIFTKKVISHVITKPVTARYIITPLLLDYENTSQALDHYCLMSFIKVLHELNVTLTADTTLTEVLSPIVKQHHRYAQLLWQRCQSLQLYFTDWLNYQTRSSAYFSNSVIKYEYYLVNNIVTHLLDILTGQMNSLDVLFPNGDSNYVNAIYQHSPESQLMNGIVADVVKQLLDNVVTDHAPIRILEVGAGTGATTQVILNLLSAAAVNYEYVYTDNALSLLNDARETFANYQQVHYQLFDLDSIDNVPNYFFQTFDLIIAANVLHATKQLANSLSLLNYCLKPSGILLILEGIQAITWLDFIFGLTPGWWNFTDERDNHPLLSAQNWQAMLATQGFAAEIIDPARASGQAVIVAQKLTDIMLKQPVLILCTNDVIYSQAFSRYAQTRGYKVVTLLFGDNHFIDGLASITQQSSDIQLMIYHWHSVTLLSVPALSQAMNQFAHLIKEKQNGVLANIPLYLVTQYAVVNSVAAIEETISPQAAMLWGMANVVRVEYPALPLTCIDQDDTHNFSLLFAEFKRCTLDSHVMHRKQIRYNGYLTNKQLANTIQSSVPLKNSTWIIAGGQGGLGQVVTRWLITQGAKHILLLSRSPLTLAAKQELGTLANSYAITLETKQLDVADPMAMQTLTHTLKANAFNFTGLLQLAGVVRDKRIKDISDKDFADVFNAKIAGTHQLISMAMQLGIANFIAFSSATAVFGNLGQINHAAANAYMDALLYQHRQQFVHAQSINWGPWSETGAAANDVLTQVKKVGILPYSNQQAIKILQLALCTKTPYLIAMNIDWQIFKDARAYLSFYQKVWPQFETDQITVDTKEQTISISSYSIEMIVQKIKTIIAKNLAINVYDLNNQMGFANYGVDSLMAISLAHKLSKALRVNLDSVVLFDYPTINELSHYIFEKINNHQENIQSLKSVTLRDELRSVLKQITETEALSR